MTLRAIDVWEINTWKSEDGEEFGEVAGPDTDGHTVHVVRESEYNALWLEVQQNAKEDCHCAYLKEPCSTCRAQAMIVAADE